MTETFEDTNETVLKNVPKSGIEYPVMKEVCEAYLTAFDKNVKEHTPSSAKKANIIRETLVKIIKFSTPGFQYMTLKDTGDIEDLRKIVANLGTYYVSQRALWDPKGFMPDPALYIR
jgi:hypothetical protein